MRNVHTVVEERGNYTFVVHNAYSGDVKEVRVDPDKIALFEDESSIAELPDACPFLRFDGKTGKAWCTVHLTRPDICRDYCCWRLLILDSQGKRAGRVMYQTTFLPDNDELSRLWEQVQPTLSGLSGTEWDDALIDILKKAGYRVRW
ncbi:MULTISPECIES: YkgJ family cysteine cluster protein [unclassified Methanoculleus]|uniref:YkgJ family cysteine cluster protein n=1 Tax=unclassified Methanoculleus TaxID=2619537 RepID=UPI0026002CF6|nr:MULTISPECIES: YkgJ family cysteine cluster protein [unclassified Methanoculleus]